MRLTVLLVVAAVALGAAPRPSSAQSLAEIAAREKERRTGKGGKVITESDLGGGMGQSFESETSSDAETGTDAEGAAPAEGAAATGAAPTEKSEDDKRQERKAALQKELDAERAHIEGIKKDVAAREIELADTSNYLIGGRRTELLKYVEDAKQAIATHEAQVEKLQEQARREGIPVR
jgi:hypothetical protein